MSKFACWSVVLMVALSLLGCSEKKSGGGPTRELMNVSYDPTRELYEKYNQRFVEHWKELKKETVSVTQAHAGSGAQSQSVINGLEADVVTLALSHDIDQIATKAKLLPEDWQGRLPHNSCPYTSTIVFMVRKGNPKSLKDWDDLLKPGVEIITPNPKTSGGARWNYLAAWGYVLRKELGDLKAINDPAKKDDVAKAQTKAREFMKELFKHTKALDTGARGSTQRFVSNKSGDVLLAWENEALYFQKMEPEEGFEIVVPSITILAEPPVAVVDKVVDRKGTRDIAEEYLKFLYEPAGQRIVAQNFYRPSNPEVMKEFAEIFPKVETFTITEVFGSWAAVQKEHFNRDAIFDQIRLENVK